MSPNRRACSQASWQAIFFSLVRPSSVSLFLCFSRWRPRSMYLRVSVKKRPLCRSVKIKSTYGTKKSKYIFDFLSSCLPEPPYKLKDCRSVGDKALYDSCSYIKFSLCSHKKKQGNLYNNKATYHTSLVIVFFSRHPFI